MQKIKVVLPAYNEELSLPSLLGKIVEVKENFNLNLDILLVNDGSTDGTLEVAKQFGAIVKILDLQPNGGLASAVREGFKCAIREMNDSDIIITMDADDSHNPGLIFRMITQIGEGSDLVIASRYRSGARIIGLSRTRKILSSGAGYLYRIFSPIKGVRDFTCGFRAYRVDLIRKAQEHYGERFIEQQGFACMGEILIKLKVFKPIIHELPMLLRYDQKKGQSKMSIFKTVKETMKLILRIK
ncbi:MAG: glycosyltransferase family 2 protein [Bacteroidetes bacterium]|jgi:dolichol-phosphate mannosyltransferase|nr:glycosyltransferase family 2 protein [Bacteroidota bacterium]